MKIDASPVCRWNFTTGATEMEDVNIWHKPLQNTLKGKSHVDPGDPSQIDTSGSQSPCST